MSHDNRQNGRMILLEQPWNLDLQQQGIFGSAADQFQQDEPEEEAQTKVAARGRKRGSSSVVGTSDEVTTKKPKGTTSAYAHFVKYRNLQIKQADPNAKITFIDMSKHCSQMWHSMTAEQKQPFHDLASQDKDRHAEQMKSYVPQPDTKKRSKKSKDPNAPKRPLNAYLWFCQELRPTVKAENPQLIGREVLKELGRRWASLEPEQKVKYEEMQRLEKERYEQEKEEYVSPSKRPPVEDVKPEPDSSSSDDDDLDFL